MREMKFLRPRMRHIKTDTEEADVVHASELSSISFQNYLR